MLLRRFRFNKVDMVHVVGLGVTVCAILVVAAIIQPRMGYNQWDNFEYYTPIIEYGQECWLGGDVPYINPHQYILVLSIPGIVLFAGHGIYRQRRQVYCGTTGGGGDAGGARES